MATASGAISIGSKRRASTDSESLTEDGDTANSQTSSISAGTGPVRKEKIRRARKSSYAIRKEERELLDAEVEALERQALVLRQRAEGRMSEKELLNAMLHEARRGQQLSCAVAQSAASGFLSAESANPLSTFIHLGKDWAERRNTLIGMKGKKIQNAFEYARARSQFLDPLKPHTSEERFETANGDYCTARFDLIQFEGVKSVKQVHDALLCYLRNIEISVTERLGHITVREDYDIVDKSVASYRLLSTQFGVDVEMNLALFAQYFESHALLNGAPCSVVTADSVDEDELNPFSPAERVRKDVTNAIVLTPHWRKKRRSIDGDAGGSEDSEGEDQELVVVMARAKFLKLCHNAEMEILPLNMQELRDNMCWGPVMVRTINELLHPELVSPSISRFKE